MQLRETDLFWREVDGEIVVLDGQKWEYLKLNESGMLLWRTLVGGATGSQLVAKLTDTYNLDEAQGIADVEAFLGRLAELNLLAA
jgi:hypothetical protein